MSIRTKTRDYLLVIAVVALAAMVAHFWITDRLGVLRAVYPAQAWLSTLQSDCSPGAPRWMPIFIEKATHKYASPSNQLAYISAQGNVYLCINGWEGAPFASEPVKADSRFRFASLTKILTAHRVLSLIETKQLDYDTTLAELFPEFLPFQDPRLESVTIHMLLTHQAGFDRLETPDPLTEHYSKPWCFYDLGQLASQTLDFEPGERYSYSNVGYCLLGAVIAKLQGESYLTTMNEAYGLEERGLLFVDGPYMKDEVRYDFRNSDFYGENYHQYFDFESLASSAGLSGSAVNLGVLLRYVIESNPEIMSAETPEDCLDVMRSCYGHAFYPYKSAGKKGLLNIQEGFLPGMTSTAYVDSEGGVVVYLGAGSPLDLLAAFDEMHRFVYEALMGS